MKYVLLLVLYCISTFIWAQEKIELKGSLFDENGTPLYQINIINKTHSYGTVSNDSGKFVFPVYLNDTIIFSSISHVNATLVISDSILNLETFTVELKTAYFELSDINLYSGINMLDTNRTFGEIDLALPFKSMPRADKNWTPGEKYLSSVSGTGPIGTIANIFHRKYIKQAKQIIALEKEIALTEKAKNSFDDSFFDMIDIPEDKIYIFLEIYGPEAAEKGLLKKDMIFDLASFLKEKSILFLGIIENENKSIKDSIQH